MVSVCMRIFMLVWVLGFGLLLFAGCDKESGDKANAAGGSKLVSGSSNGGNSDCGSFSISSKGDSDALKRYHNSFKLGQWLLSIRAEGIDGSWSLERGLLQFVNKQTKKVYKYKFNANDIIKGACAGDLDGDGCPEITVFQGCAGSGSYGVVTTFELENGKVKSYTLPMLKCVGYEGHDSFKMDVSTGELIRKFPLYGKDNTNAEPLNGKHIIVYRFGRKGWKEIRQADIIGAKAMQRLKNKLGI